MEIKNLKMKDFENLRTLSLIGISTLSAFNNVTNSDLDSIVKLMISLYYVEVGTSFYTSRLTKEYHELESLYNEVIKSIVELINDFDFKSPVEIFSTYVYLLRKGYLSHNHQFIYDIDMKDLSYLQGIDIIRGSGVCRSISSGLTDIYNSYGFKSSNLVVYANNDACRNLQKLCDSKLLKCDRSQKLAKIAASITSIIRNPNHLITYISDNEYNYVLDPTNDGMLYIGDNNSLYIPNTDIMMRFYPNFQKITSLIGFLNCDINIINRNLKQISDKDYRIIYLNALKICKENIDLLEQFYNKNAQLYDDIYKLSNEQRSLFGRLIPIIPKKILTKL